MSPYVAAYLNSAREGRLDGQNCAAKLASRNAMNQQVEVGMGYVYVYLQG